MDELKLFLKYNSNRRYYNNSSKEEILNDIKSGRTFPSEEKVNEKILILLHASYACNLKCIYCENGELRKRYNNAVMTEETIKNVVKIMGPITKEITWHGGEPLVLPDNLLRTLHDELQKYNYDIPVSLQTNSVLYECKKELLDELNIRYGTSFDGLYNTHNRGKASTDAIFNRLRNKEDIGFITVFINNTIDDIIKNYEYYKSLGITQYQTTIVRENVIQNSNPYIIKNEKAILNVLKYIDYWIHDTNNPIHDSFIERQIQRVAGQNASVCEYIYCIGGWVYIDPLGNISFCGQSAIDHPICNVNEMESYKDFYNSKNYMISVAKQKNLANKCKKSCIWYDRCYGGCFGLNFETDPDYKQVSQRNCEFQISVLNGVYELIKNIDINDTENYNPLFLQILKANNYISLREAYEIEEGKNNG